MKHVYFIGICGTAMGNLAGLLAREGWRVSGSDRAFYPPISDALAKWGIETKIGWNVENITSDVDLVIVGNVCRRDNPEVLAAEELGIVRSSLPAFVAEEIVRDRRSVAVAGTHGKSTTTALLAWLLQEGQQSPGYMVAALVNQLDPSFVRGATDAPFIVEADEYDTAFFEKTPKFWHYRATDAVLTSIEHDHIDIYPTAEDYVGAFDGLLARLPEDGHLVAYAGDPGVRSLLEGSSANIIWYGVEGDDFGACTPTWLAAPVKHHHIEARSSGRSLTMAAAQPVAHQSFDLFTAGSFCGRFTLPLLGVHNLRNALAALAMATEVCGASLSQALESVSRFSGLAKRQQWLGRVGRVDFFDDFAHHPTAVRETLRGFAARYPERRVVAVFEPRSATACRSLHQEQYVAAFAPAKAVLLAPVGRTEIQAAESLDTKRLARAIAFGGAEATSFESHEALVSHLIDALRPDDVVVFMSNGSFGTVKETAIQAFRSHGTES